MFLFIFLIVSIIVGVGVYMINWCETLTIKGHRVESDHIGWAIVWGTIVFSIAYVCSIIGHFLRMPT